MNSPDISIVVCTFNRAAVLRLALESLLRQEMGGICYEIVVVDNASTDDTQTVVQEICRRAAVEVVYVHEPVPGVAIARNRGIERSRGTWIAFFDDDQLADSRWLYELLLEAERRGVSSVGGSVSLKLPPECTVEPVGVTRRMLGEAILSDQACPYGRKHAPGAGNWMLRREIFDHVGRFDPAMENGGEDTELFRRIRAAGFQSWYTPAAVVHHLIPAGRLEPDHLQRTALRIGSHVAQREYTDYGRISFACLLVVRFLQGLLLFRTRMFFWNRFRGSAQQALAHQCVVWRCRGYCRWGLRTLLPRWFAQHAYFGRLSFREDRVPSRKKLQSVQS